MSEFFVEYRAVFIFIHALTAAIALGATLTTDFLFFQFLRDYKISRVESSLFKSVSSLFPILLGMTILTGLAIYFSDPGRYIVSSKFITKMLAVFVVLCNGVFLHNYVSPRLQKLDFTHRKFVVTKRLAFASGAVSMTSWLSSYILGSLPKIPFTIPEGLVLYVCFVALGIAGSQIIYVVTESRGAKA